MASYKYEIVGPDGKPKSGTIEAQNIEMATAELKAGGSTIVSIARANAFNKDLEIHIGKAVSVRELSVFCRQFESVLNAGVTVIEALNMLSEQEKNKVEFLCNECCWFGCKDRKQCYEIVSRKNLGEMIADHECNSPDAKEGYRFSKAMKNPGFISVDDIKKIYLPMGFENFKIEGRGLGSALVLEFLLYYMVKPEYQICVREEIYLDNMLDLF